MKLFSTLGASRYSDLALVWVALLLAGGLLVTVLGEQSERRQMQREAGAQADLLASAVRGALAFGDDEAAQDYLDAIQINSNVLAAAVYDDRHQLVAGFARPGETLQEVAGAAGASTVLRQGRLSVVRPVEQAGQTLGTVRMRLEPRPLAQRLSRYAGFGLIILLAALVVFILAIAQRALRRANTELESRAEALAAANNELQAEILERAKAEEALRQSQKMEAIGRMTGGVAHDFNNLLMAVSSGVELLERTEDPGRRQLLREGVRQAVDRGAALTGRLLAFSRTTPLQSEVIDLASHIESMRMLFERSLREDVELRLELPRDLWPVEIDPGELELALLNLAVNARDAMPNGGTVTIRGENRYGGPHSAVGDHVELSVSDTGQGIDPGALDQVFEPFFTTKEIGKGTGLGLSQVYGFARSSGGEATIKSTPGEGATVFLCLPRSTKPPTERKSPARSTPTQGEGRILLVEDDDAVAEGVGQMLADLGYEFDRAASGPEALRRLEARAAAYDLVFSDMVMPGGLDGLSLAKAVRKSRPDLPVLLTTGYSESAAKVAAADFPLLMKPYRLEALAEAIAQTTR